MLKKVKLRRIGSSYGFLIPMQEAKKYLDDGYVNVELYPVPAHELVKEKECENCKKYVFIQKVSGATSAMVIVKEIIPRSTRRFCSAKCRVYAHRKKISKQQEI